MISGSRARNWHLVPVKPSWQLQAIVRWGPISTAKHSPPLRHWVLADSAEVHAEEIEIIVSIKTLLWHTNIHDFTLTNKSANDSYYGIGPHLPKMWSSIIITNGRISWIIFIRFILKWFYKTSVNSLYFSWKGEKGRHSSSTDVLPDNTKQSRIVTLRSIWILPGHMKRVVWKLRALSHVTESDRQRNFKRKSDAADVE